MVRSKTFQSPSTVGSSGWLPCSTMVNSGSAVGSPMKGASPRGTARLPTKRRTFSRAATSCSVQPGGMGSAAPPPSVSGWVEPRAAGEATGEAAASVSGLLPAAAVRLRRGA